MPVRIVAVVLLIIGTALPAQANDRIFADAIARIDADTFEVQQIAVASPEHLERLTHGVIIASAFSDFLDGMSTTYAFGINKGSGVRRFREANKLWAWAEQNVAALAAVKTGAAVGKTYLLIWLHKKSPVAAIILGGLSTGVTLYIAKRNLDQTK